MAPIEPEESNKAYILNTRNLPPKPEEKKVILQVVKALASAGLLASYAKRVIYYTDDGKRMRAWADSETIKALPEERQDLGIYKITLKQPLKLPEMRKALESKGLDVLLGPDWEELAQQGKEKYPSELGKELELHRPIFANPELAHQIANSEEADPTDLPTDRRKLGLGKASTKLHYFGTEDDDDKGTVH